MADLDPFCGKSATMLPPLSSSSIRNTSSWTIFRQALVTTVLIIGSTFLLVHIINKFWRKMKQKSIISDRTESRTAVIKQSSLKNNTGYKVIGQGLNFEQQSLQFKVSTVIIIAVIILAKDLCLKF